MTSTVATRETMARYSSEAWSAVGDGRTLRIGALAKSSLPGLDQRRERGVGVAREVEQRLRVDAEEDRRRRGHDGHEQHLRLREAAWRFFGVGFRRAAGDQRLRGTALQRRRALDTRPHP